VGIEHPKYKVAVDQASPVWCDLDATVAKTIALIEEAAKKGAKLIAFPETFIPGYPWHIWLAAPAWGIGRGFVQRYFDIRSTTTARKPKGLLGRFAAPALRRSSACRSATVAASTWANG
jgi:hypothetical protein